jgi:predicted HicB family RNase H-like nuclease
MGADPKDYVVGPEAVIEDVDLDDEEIYLRDGTRLTEQIAEQIAADTIAEIRRRNLIPGRKSLTGGSVHSPRVQFRVPENIRAQAEQRAAAEGKSISALAREALEHYLRAS